jgi:hypothetical protein
LHLLIALPREYVALSLLSKCSRAPPLVYFFLGGNNLHPPKPASPKLAILQLDNGRTASNMNSRYDWDKKLAIDGFKGVPMDCSDAGYRNDRWPIKLTILKSSTFDDVIVSGQIN